MCRTVARKKKKEGMDQLGEIGELGDADEIASTKRGARTKRSRKLKTFSDQQTKKAALDPQEVESALLSTTVDSHALGRERKVQKYTQKTGRHQNTKSGARVGYVPKTSDVTAAQRVREFPNNHLTEGVNGTLFCNLCLCEIHNYWRKSLVAQHANSNKHVAKLEKAKTNEVKVPTIDRLFREALKKL